jgi:Cu(I)/Ag(I) efflux system membrane protein CusA/SilA
VLRVRPKDDDRRLVHHCAIFVGSGTGSEVMCRIAAPMIGGMLTAPAALNVRLGQPPICC